MAEEKKLADEQAEKVSGGGWFSNLWNKVKDGTDDNAIYGVEDDTALDIFDESVGTK